MNGVQALNRNLPDRFQHATSGQLKLPRFQRFEAWGDNEAANLLESKEEAERFQAVSLKGGARDFADDEPATRQHLARRECHRLFPEHLLTGEGQSSSTDSFRAMDCALVTWNTNRRISSREPLECLQERTRAAVLGEEEVRRRLWSHLVPYDELSVGNWDDIRGSTARASQIDRDYKAFLLQRATMMREAVEVLAEEKTGHG